MIACIVKIWYTCIYIGNSVWLCFGISHISLTGKLDMSVIENIKIYVYIDDNVRNLILIFLLLTLIITNIYIVASGIVQSMNQCAQ
jgi:hypothetical protein